MSFSISRVSIVKDTLISYTFVVNRKPFFISLAVFLVAVLFIIWVAFFRQAPTEPGAELPIDPNPFPVGTPSTNIPPPVSLPSSPSSPTAMAVDEKCAGAGNVFEKNDCISTLAEERGDRTLCDYVTGSLAADECRKGKSAQIVVTPLEQSRNKAYETFIDSYFSSSVSAIATNPASRAASAILQPTTSAPRVDESMVLYDLSFGAPLAVYAASRYQAAPGSFIKIYGSGFAETDNILNIGVQQSTVGSADGSTINTVAPASIGEYEIWVTNAKGSSRVAARPVKILITDSPQPLPVIERATPSPVSIDGVVTLVGKGFGSSNNVLTSMGILENVSSNGTSMSFSVSSLPFSSYSKEVPELKGRVVPVFVNIQTSGGASETMFQFDVQL